MGFVALAVVGGAAFAAMVLLRLPRLLWTFAGAALFLGASGYAWQGSPGQAAAPAQTKVEAIPVTPEEIALRDRLMGRFTADTAYLVASDAMLRSGDRRAAAQVALGGVRAIPKSYILWTQLGSNLAIHDGNQVSPASKLAYEQAMRLAPEHPAPSYYAALSYLRAGNLPAGRRLLKRAADMSVPGTEYGVEIARQLNALDRYITTMEQVAAMQSKHSPNP